MQPVYFKKLEPGAQVPTRAHANDAGWDLYTSRRTVIPAGDYADVHTDLAIAMPRGVWGFITGRSSTVRKYGMRVEQAVIDNGYRGEMFVGLWNLRDFDQEIEVGVRVAQLIFLPLYGPIWVETEELAETERGDDGFGSTGR